MTLITSSLFDYDAHTRTFLADASELPMFNSGDGFVLVSSKTDRRVAFTYVNVRRNGDEIAAWNYVAYVDDAVYTASIFND